jgi:DNA-binding transcriptional regulator PaaX
MAASLAQMRMVVDGWLEMRRFEKDSYKKISTRARRGLWRR